MMLEFYRTIHEEYPDKFESIFINRQHKSFSDDVFDESLSLPLQDMKVKINNSDS